MASGWLPGRFGNITFIFSDTLDEDAEILERKKTHRVLVYLAAAVFAALIISYIVMLKNFGVV